MPQKALTFAIIFLLVTLKANAETLTTFKSGQVGGAIWQNERGERKDHNGVAFSPYCTSVQCPDIKIRHSVSLAEQTHPLGETTILPNGHLCVEGTFSFSGRHYLFDGGLENHGTISICPSKHKTNPMGRKYAAYISVDGNYKNLSTDAMAVSVPVSVAPDEGGVVNGGASTGSAVQLHHSRYMNKNQPRIGLYRAFIGTVPKWLPNDTTVRIANHTGTSHVSHLDQMDFKLFSANKLNAEGKQVTFHIIPTTPRDNEILANNIIVQGESDNVVNLVANANEITVRSGSRVTIKTQKLERLIIEKGATVTLSAEKHNAYGRAYNNAISATVENHGRLRLSDSPLVGNVINYGTIKNVSNKRPRPLVLKAGASKRLENHNVNQPFFVSCQRGMALTPEQYYNTRGIEVHGSCDFDMPHANITAFSSYVRGGGRNTFNSTGAITLGAKTGFSTTINAATKVNLSTAPSFSRIYAPNIDIYVSDQDAMILGDIKARNLFVEASNVKLSGRGTLTDGIHIDQLSSLVSGDTFGVRYTANRLVNHGVLGYSGKIRAAQSGDGLTIKELRNNTFYQHRSFNPPRLSDHDAALEFASIKGYKSLINTLDRIAFAPNMIDTVQNALSEQCFLEFQDNPNYNTKGASVTRPSPYNFQQQLAQRGFGVPTTLKEASTRRGLYPKINGGLGTILGIGVSGMIFQNAGMPNPAQCAADIYSKVNPLALVQNIASNPGWWASMWTMARGGVREFSPESIEYIEDNDADIVLEKLNKIHNRESEDEERELLLIKEIILAAVQHTNGHSESGQISTKALNIFGKTAIPLVADILHTDMSKSLRTLPDCMSKMMTTLDPNDFDNDCNAEYLDLLNHKRQELKKLTDSLIPNCREMEPEPLVSGWGKEAYECANRAITGAYAGSNVALDILPDIAATRRSNEDAIKMERIAARLLAAAHKFNDDLSRAHKALGQDTKNIFFNLAEYYERADEFVKKRRGELYGELSKFPRRSPERRQILSEASALLSAKRTPSDQAWVLYHEHGYKGENPFDSARELLLKAHVAHLKAQSDALGRLRNELEDVLNVMPELSLSIHNVTDAIAMYQRGLVKAKEAVSTYDMDSLARAGWLSLNPKLNAKAREQISKHTEDDFVNFMKWKGWVR